MFTPIELENITFKSGVIGFDRNEVNDFLNAISTDYEKLYKENIALKDKNTVLSDAIKEYKTMETALRDTVVSAHSVSDDIKKNAYKEAENILRDAKLKCDEMISEASKNLTEQKLQLENLKQQYSIYESKIKSIIRAQLEILDTDEEQYKEILSNIAEN